MQSELVSIIIPTYKRAESILRAVECVFNQTYKETEIIIVDDNGLDSKEQKETEAVLRTLIDEKRVIYFTHDKNRGANAARNTGLKNSKGDYIAFLDDDDEWMPEKIEKQVAVIEKDNSIGIVYTKMKILYEDYDLSYITNPQISGYVFDKQIIENYIGGMISLLIRKKAILENPLDINLPARQDYDLLIRISKKWKIILVDDVLTVAHAKFTKDRISSNVDNYINAIKVLNRKYREEIDSLPESKKILRKAEQNFFLGSQAIKANRADLARKYYIKSVKFKFSIKSFLAYIVSFFGVRFTIFLRSARSKNVEKKIEKAAAYSPLEKKIARFLSKHPGLKKRIKRTYQYLIWIIKRKKYNFECIYSVEPVGTINEAEIFYGYYDKNPENKKGTHIIYHCASLPTAQRPHPDIPIEICIEEIETQKTQTVKTYAYNWQQGSRVQWISDDKVVFNDYDSKNDKLISKIFNIKQGKIEKNMPLPVYDCFQDKFSISLNFTRLADLSPDYGYFNIKEEMNKPLSEDGIFRLDLQTGENELIISLSALASGATDHFFGKIDHSVNHIMISPHGEKFIFIYRFYIKGERKDKLFVSSVDGSHLTPLIEDGLVSHCFWINENTIIGYVTGPDGTDAYWKIDIDSGQFTKIGDKSLNKYGDGHPHVHGEWFVTDTYPDKSMMQRLLLVNWKTGYFKELGEFFHSIKYHDITRCDLHPRFSEDGKVIYFDTVFTGKRANVQAGFEKMSISVLLSVYKNEKPQLLDRSLISIWDDQTVKPCEIVIVKDGPLTDELELILEKWDNRLGPQFKIVCLKENVGLACALNEGLRHCSSELVARMDTDDISLPERFECQIQYMRNNSNIDVCSALIEEINENEEVINIRRIPINHKEIYSFAKSRNPISHPVVIYKKEAVLSVGGYPDYRKSQDYALWSLMLHKGFNFGNINKILLKMRTGNDLFQRRGKGYLGYELQILNYQRKIGFITFSRYIKNIFIRSIVRLSPGFIKKFLYKHVRG